ncbi:MAG: hypothetical protein KA479_06225 [Saprospiraceae bacterium]|nr:hypothetical protein [Saprospiraceae bacterium]
MLLRIAVVSVLLLVGTKAWTQCFLPVPGPTIDAEVSVNLATEVYIHFENLTEDSLRLRWRRMDSSIPESWDVDLCDFGSCYIGVPASAYMNWSGPYDEPYIKLIVQPGNNPGAGWYWFRVYNAVDESQFQDVYFNLNTPGFVGVNQIAGLSEMSVLPNPVSSHLTIHNPTAFANRLHILHINGMPRWHGFVPSDESIQIDVTTWPAGYYFMVSEASSKLLIIQH